MQSSLCFKAGCKTVGEWNDGDTRGTSGSRPFREWSDIAFLLETNLKAKVVKVHYLMGLENCFWLRLQLHGVKVNVFSVAVLSENTVLQLLLRD